MVYNGVARKLGLGKTVFDLVPLGWEMVYLTCWRCELRAQPKPRTQSPRIEGEAGRLSGGRGLGRGLGEPLPRKILNIHT